MRRWIKVAGAMLLGVGALVGGPATRAPAVQPPLVATLPQLVLGTDIGIVGDSLTVGSATALTNELTARGLASRIDAQVGRSIPGGVAAVQALRDSGFDSLVWVVALGTNDVWWDQGCGCGITPATASTRIQQMLDAIGPGRYVYWVNLNRTDIPQAVSVFNQALVQAAVNRASLRIVDFHGLSSANPSWFAGDGVHLTSTGYTQRAIQIAAAAATSPVAYASRALPTQLGPFQPERAPGAYATRGDRGDHVRALQDALIARGFSVAGGADGIFGAGTESAVKAFQQSIGVRPTGLVTDKTAAALGLGP